MAAHAPVFLMGRPRRCAKSMSIGSSVDTVPDSRPGSQALPGFLAQVEKVLRPREEILDLASIVRRMVDRERTLGHCSPSKRWESRPLRARGR